MLKKSLLVFFLMSVHTVLFAQSDISSKLSITTQLFLLDRDSKYALHRKIPAVGKISARNQTEALQGNYDNGNRIYAAPEVHNGVSYISAFILLKNENMIYELESKGVMVQCVFRNGLLTANIPVDSIESVARITNVEYIKIATPMHTMSKVSRTKTNVVNILDSVMAVSSGLQHKYDGKGVILGVIDQGIDFQHISFKDKDGNFRVKRAYVKNDSIRKIYTNFSENEPFTDCDTLDHGTHTSSIAGGSSVIIKGNSVTVTDDHNNATFGGIAPGTDLYLAGIKDLTDTHICEAIKLMCSYADTLGKPIVISNSWGNQFGPHDGTGIISDVILQNFSSELRNHICLFASSNLAGFGREGGGCHIQGIASKLNPLGTVLRSGLFYNADDCCGYNGVLADAWNRSGGELSGEILVIDKKNSKVLETIPIAKKNIIIGIPEIDKYYCGKGIIQVISSKNRILIQTTDTIRTCSTTPKMLEDKSIVYESDYALAVQFYPTNGSAMIDVWSDEENYFIDNPYINGYDWSNGSDDSSVSNEATNPNVITVGAYVSNNDITDYSGRKRKLSDKNETGDIAHFSGYQETGKGPTGEMIPWITAPGFTVVSAVNHFHTHKGYMDNEYEKSGKYRVNTNMTYPYGNMNGTSVATPIVSGIVALWLQAATELGLSLTTSDVKNIMKYTAIKDKFTNGKNASHFGNGKIDALAGIKAIVAPELTIKHDDYYNKLFVNFKTFVCPCTVSVSCLNKAYPKEVAREIIKNYNDTLSFNTDYWERGKYYIEIKYGNKNIIDTVMLNHVGRQPKLDAKIKGEYIVVNFKFSDRNTKGELRMYKSSEYCKKGFNASPIYSDNVDMTDYGDYLIEKKYFNTNDVVFALFENGRCVAMTSIDSSSNVFASIQKNQQKLNVMYQIPSLSKDAYIEISKKTKSDVKLALKDAVYTNGNNIDGTIRRYVDSEECEFGSEMFDCTDWEDGDYIVSLCQNGKEITKTDIHISRCSAIKRVVKDNNSVNITYDLGKEAKSAYVVVTDIDGTMRYVKELSLSSTNCSIDGNFRDCKFINVLLYVNGVLVSNDKY